MEKAQAETNRCDSLCQFYRDGREPSFRKFSEYYLCLHCGAQYPYTPEEVQVELADRCPEHGEPMLLGSCPECDLEEE